MIRYLLLISLLISSGCASASITTKHGADGKQTDCTAQYMSLFREVDTASMSACGGKGSAAGVKVNNELAGALLKSLLVTP